MHLCRNEFFCFFLIKVDRNVVGVINVQGHGKDIVSIAPEIFEEYRGNGFAYKSLSLAYMFAKDKGFKELTAGIREENFASQKLHEKLGVKYVKNSKSKNGNVLKIYTKQLKKRKKLYNAFSLWFGWFTTRATTSCLIRNTKKWLKIDSFFVFKFLIGHTFVMIYVII